MKKEEGGAEEAPQNVWDLLGRLPDVDEMLAEVAKAKKGKEGEVL